MNTVKVEVRVWQSREAFIAGHEPIVSYSMNHLEDAQRRRLGQECTRAFEAGQLVMTWGSA